MNSKNRRGNHAVRFAQAADLGRLTFALTWGAFGGPPAGVSKRAARVLLMFCAANRCGKIGYRGVRAALWSVAAAVSRCSGGEAASPSTVRRGLHELVSAGYLVSAVYGGGAPRLVACGDGESHWVRDQQVAYTLTDQALACWSWSRESGAVERRASRVGNGEPVSCDSVGVPSCDPNKRNEGFPISSSLGDFENTPMRAACVIDHALAVEHLEAEPERCAPASSPTRCGSSGQVEARRCASPGGAAGAVPTEAGKVGPQKAGRIVGYSGGRAIRFLGSGEPGSGERRSPEAASAGSVPMQSRREIEAALVIELGKQGRAGRLHLAAASMALSDPSSWSSSPLPWWEWVKRWPRLTRAEQWHLVRSEIRPSLAAELSRRILSPVPSESGNNGEIVTSEKHNNDREPVTMAEAMANNSALRETMEKLLGHPLKPE